MTSISYHHPYTQGRSAKEQYEAVIAGFPSVPPWFRVLFPYSKWGAELNARITPAFFSWLVGRMETIDVEIPVDMAVEIPGDGSNVVHQQSGVQIKGCRYLKESQCTGMCVNLCKIPTQTFFTEYLGMPLYMEPNFEDYSCKMVFGMKPPELGDDPVMAQPCLQDCPMGKASSSRPCHTLE